MPNISSKPFELIIAGIDRSSVMDVINLSQPSTLEAGDAPITGKITLKFSSRDRNDFTYTTSPTIAARFAVGALVTYRIANDSGALIYHPLSGQQLFILKKPSPPVGNILTLQVGCILAYQDQRTADFDPSGVTIGTDTPRNTVIERILQAAGITNYSVPSLPYPFNCPAEKTGGSLPKMAAAIAKAVNHVTYCNSSGQVIVAPINLDASPVATLAIGSDDVSFEPVDGSAIPDITELTVSGVCQVPDQGNYPLISIRTKSIPFQPANISGTVQVIYERVTQEISSENYMGTVTDTRPYTVVRSSPLSPVQSLIILEGDYYPFLLEDVVTQFDSQNRLSKRVKRTHRKTYDFVYPPNSIPFAINGTVFRESNREVEYFEYSSNGALSTYIKEVYTGTFTTGQDFVSLFPVSRIVVTYQQNGAYWVKSTINEVAFTDLEDAFQGREIRTVVINGVSYELLGFPIDIPVLNLGFTEGLSSSESNNDDSTRPPAIVYSEKVKTKNKEIKAIINATPLAGAASKEKHSPLNVDWLVSNEQAYDYGKLEIVLMNGRSQCRFMITQLTDELLALRPRARIDIIFEGILYRCLVDAINFAQDAKRRTVGFMCDVVSTSPAATPSTVYKLSTPVNGLRASIAIDAIASGSLNQVFDSGSIIIDAIVSGVLAEEGQITGEITINANVFGVLIGA